MTLKEAKLILTEMNKWRRGEEEYTYSNPDVARGVPYTPKEFGEAIDVAIDAVAYLMEKAGIE